MHIRLYYNDRMTIAFVIVGIICIIYGVTIMAAASGTPFFAVWYVLGVLFFAAAWALHAGWWENAPLLFKRAIQVVVGLAIALVVVTQGFALSAFSSQGEDDLDYLIVLGAQVHPTGRATCCATVSMLRTTTLWRTLGRAASSPADKVATRCIRKPRSWPNTWRHAASQPSESPARTPR